MRNFGRTLRVVLRYPGTLAASAACAILVAVLWGANISGVYPIVEIIFGGKGGQTLQSWIDERITVEQAAVERTQGEIRAAEIRLRDAGEGERREIEDELRGLERELGVSESVLARRKWIQPYIHKLSAARRVSDDRGDRVGAGGRARC